MHPKAHSQERQSPLLILPKTVKGRVRIILKYGNSHSTVLEVRSDYCHSLPSDLSMQYHIMFYTIIYFFEEITFQSIVIDRQVIEKPMLQICVKKMEYGLSSQYNKLLPSCS